MRARLMLASLVMVLTGLVSGAQHHPLPPPGHHSWAISYTVWCNCKRTCPGNHPGCLLRT